MVSIIKALLMKELGHQIRDFEVVKIQEWDVRIAVDSYVWQSQERCVTVGTIRGLDKLILENESYSWILELRNRLWAGRNVISHDDLNGDLGQFEKILQRHRRARSDEKPIVGRERCRRLSHWERLIGALIVHDRLHVRASNGCEVGESSGLRVGDQDGRADSLEEGREGVHNHVFVVDNPRDAILEKLVEPGLSKLCFREVLQKFCAKTQADKCRLVALAVCAIGDDLFVEQGPESSIKGRETGLTPPRKIDDVHREASA